MSRRKRLELDERRAQLLALAQKIFAAKSYDDVSIDDLAVAAEVSKGLFYHYFPSKRALYVATIRAAADELTKRALPDEALGLGPREQVFYGVDGYLSYVEANKAAFTALMQGGIGRDRQVQAILEEVRQRFVSAVVARLSPGLMTPIQGSLVRGWLGMVEAASLDWLAHKQVSRAELTKLLVKTLLYALELGSALKG